MYFSKPQDIIDNQLYLLKGRFNEDTRRTTKQDRTQIKINKNKLPSDFFQKSLQKSLPRKSVLDSTNRLSLPKTTFLRKYPQTQRKINSYYVLPQSPQFDHPIDFAMAKTHNLRAQTQNRKSLNRKARLMQINSCELDFQQIKTLKDYVKPKCIKRKEASEILESNSELRNIIKQRFPNKIFCQQMIQQSHTIPQEIDMGCTFGKGFKLSQNRHDNSIEFSNPKSSRLIGQDQKFRHKQSQKSTQESEVYEGLKSNQNSGNKEQIENKINFAIQQGFHQEHAKVNKIHWNVYKQDLSLYQGLNYEKSKQVFTAQERQRKSKNRVNNSSNDNRQRVVRKEKKMENLNLPRISRLGKSARVFQI